MTFSRLFTGRGAAEHEDADQDAFWSDHWDADPELADLRLRQAAATPGWLDRLLSWIERPVHG